MVVTGSTRNRLGGQKLSRGFESHPLRQNNGQALGAMRQAINQRRDARDGRRGTTGNRVFRQKRDRGFESLSLRQKNNGDLDERRISGYKKGGRLIITGA